MRAVKYALAASVVLVAGGCSTQTRAAPAHITGLTAPASPRVTAEVEGMKKLGFMLGQWEGSGWSLGQRGERDEFTQAERVSLQLSGEVMTVQGTGSVRGVPTFSAFATATFDPASGTYPWQAFSQGSRVDTTLVVADNHFTWSFDPAPGVTVRFAASFVTGTWHETGETSTDGGTTWRPTLDMTLNRVAGTS